MEATVLIKYGNLQEIMQPVSAEPLMLSFRVALTTVCVDTMQPAMVA